MENKKKLATPKDVSGGGSNSEKTYRRSVSTAVDDDMETIIRLAFEHKEEGKKLFQERDHEGAMLKYGKAIDLLPKDHIGVADLRTSIAYCYMQRGLRWYPNAISEFDLALEASPRYIEALLKRSSCYEVLNKLNYAFMDARTVLNMEPKNSSANEIFERVKMRLVEEGVDVDEMEKNFVSVKPLDAEETNYMDQEAKDHLLAQEKMDKTKLGLDSLENPKAQPLRILGESSTKTHTYRLYSKGLLSEERINGVLKVYGGAGLSLCDPSNNSKFETKLGLKNAALENSKAAELAAIVQGLKLAWGRDVKSIQFFCNDSTILDYVTHKAAPPPNVAKILDQVALRQKKFTSCQALPLSTDISSVITLARDAIAVQKTWLCNICFEDVSAEEDKKFTVSGCAHRFCKDCMMKHIRYCLKQRDRLICPMMNCKSYLDPADCNQIADPGQLALMVERKAEESIEVSDRVYCPNPRCSILMSARGLPVFDPALPVARKCLKCGFRFCLNCKMEWHTKLSCAEFRQTKAYTKSGTAVFDAAARELGLKKCRKCLCTVERAEGCKHITCTFCKYEFCYTCGNEWKNKKPTCRCATKV